MGKSKKLNKLKANRNNPLDQQIIENECAKSSRVKYRNRQDDDEEFVNDKLSKKILDQARKQKEDLEYEHMTKSTGKEIKETTQVSVFGQSSYSSDSEDDLDVDETCFYEDIKINEEDEKALELFMNKEPASRITLADIIKEKLAEKETEIQTQFSDAGNSGIDNMSEKAVNLYRDIRKLLANYRSGKLPKAFKIIPLLQSWEQVLNLTEPENWTAAAVYQATRIFVSNLGKKRAPRFYSLVLLPRLRDDIAEFKKLNFHMYQALQKALFRPDAFFKGIIFPLCQSGTCTLREATIIGSVMVKSSIPVNHSSAAIIKISKMDYSGANSIILRILLEKKYALQDVVIDAIVSHFLRFSMDKRDLPVLWHQCLLTFIQYYNSRITTEQQENLLNLLCIHKHEQITPEIRRELQNFTPRQEENMVTEQLS